MVCIEMDLLDSSLSKVRFICKKNKARAVPKRAIFAQVNDALLNPVMLNYSS